MSFVLGLAQCCHPAVSGTAAVLEMAEDWCKRASQQGVQVLVFPESLMTRYEEGLAAFHDAAQPLDGPFCCAMDALAAKYGLWLVYTANERNDGGNPFNTAVLVNPDGVKRGVYRKVHLFDTDFTRESDRMASGDCLFEPVDTPFGRIGLSICYDLRFPEVARFAALRGCQVLINPAAWVDGPLKAQQWRTLLSARAIENEMFVAGVSRADSGYIGRSVVFGPGWCCACRRRRGRGTGGSHRRSFCHRRSAKPHACASASQAAVVLGDAVSLVSLRVAITGTWE